MYEYKFMPAPRQVRKGQVTQNDGDALTRTLDSEISLIAHGGWEFVRTERMPVTGRWLFLPVRRQQEFMVFRRPLSEPERPAIPVMETAQTVRPRRIQPTGTTATARPGSVAVA